MTELTNRQQNILLAIVKHYIKTAQPVGSRWLAESHSWGCSPATIRNDMSLLEELRYIFQPFTSAGRVPLDHGYRFFVDAQLQQLSAKNETNELLSSLMDKQAYDSWDDLLQELCLKLSHQLQSNVVIATVDNQVYSAGLQYLLQNPEFRETEHILPLIRLIEDNRQMFSFLQNLEFQAQKQVVLLIGKEHFWGSFAPYTTVAGYFSNPSQRGWVTVFGPTRMHYSRNIATLSQLTTELSALETLFIEEI